MKRKIINIIACLALLLTVACQGKTTKNNSSAISDTTILQLKDYLHNHALKDTPLSEKEIELEIPILIDYLKQNNYQFIPDSVFDQKLYDVFGIKKGDVCYPFIYHEKFFTYVTIDYNNVALEAKTKAEEMNQRISNNKELELLNSDNIIFIYHHNAISAPVRLRDMATLNEKNELELNIPPYILHRNSYLLNNSASSLTWLLNNDQEFLKQLVRWFGYDKESKINKLVLEDAYNSTIKYSHASTMFENLFAKKDDCNHKVQVREGLMKYILETTSKEDHRLLDMMEDYGYILCTKDKEYVGLYENFTDSERIKVIAYVGYYVELARKKNKITGNEPSWKPGSLLRNEFVGHEELLKEFQKNNYYNLPDFENMVNEILYQIAEDQAYYDRTH